MAATGVTAPPAPEPGAGVESIRDRGAHRGRDHRDGRRRPAAAPPATEVEDEAPEPVAPGRLDVVA